jgi:hypothetical protein
MRVSVQFIKIDFSQMGSYHRGLPPWLFKSLIKLVIFASLLHVCEGNTPFEDYEKCRDEQSFGKDTLICDPDNTLKNQTVQKLEKLLNSLQVWYFNCSLNP